MTTDLSTLQQLAVRHRAAKRNEDTYKAERLEIEAEIVKITGLKSHGQKTVEVPGFKLTVKPNYGYAMAWDAFDAIASSLPENLVKTKRVLNESAVRALREESPSRYAVLASVLTVTPNKPSLEITEIQ